MPNLSKKRRTFWIADKVTPGLRERGLLLGAKGYDVQFFTNLEALTLELTLRRASIIVVSDDGEENATAKIVIALAGVPEVQGARLVMVRHRHSERISALAACANFRDFIPADLEERLWLTRFVYATAGRSLPYTQPAGQITLNNISAVVLPARLTWLSANRVRLECRASPPPGASLTLSGALANACGVSQISLRVVSCERQRLLYRFSDAIIAEWSLPQGAKDAMQKLLSELQTSDSGPRTRVFVAVQSAQLRSAVLARFADPQFEVSTPLQKQSIVDEPKFFSPSIVLIEEALCVGENRDRFEQMLANLEPKTSVAVLGRFAEQAAYQGRFPDLRIVQVPSPIERLGRMSLVQLLPEAPTPAAAKNSRQNPAQTESQKELQLQERRMTPAMILGENPLSFAEITFPARLQCLHPMAAQVAMPFPVSTFALVRLESPLLRRILGRHPYLKLTATYPGTHPAAGAFVHLADGYLADVDPSERQALITGISRLATESLARLDPHGSFAADIQRPSHTRTPELGSIKRVGAQPPSAAAQIAAGRSMPSDDLHSGRSVAAARSIGTAALAEIINDINQTSDPELRQPVIPVTKEAELAESPAKRRFVDERVNTDSDKAPITFKIKNIKSKPKGVHTAPINPQQIMIAVALLAFAGAVIWGVVSGLEGRVSKSGGVYTDQLYKFAPHLSPEPGKP